MELAVTGPPGSGKTTLCQRLIEALDCDIGGILTQEVRDDEGKRIGFAVRDVATGTEGTLASTGRAHGPRVGKYRVHLEGLERIAIPAIDRALREANLIVVDEVAPMELASEAFVDVTEQALAADCPLLVTFKGRQNHPLIRRIRDDCELYEINVDTREAVFETLRDQLRDRA